MTSNEIARREPLEASLAIRDEHTDSWIAVVQPIAELAAQVANTEFVPKALRNKPDAITAAVLFGRELDMPPMHALSNIHMVEGKPTLAAETMRAMVFAAGHEIGYGEVSGSICEVKGRRSGSTEWTIIRWSIADAQRAGVAKKDVWVKYPRQMLTARATAELCRMIFPDVTHNIRATEELEDGEAESLAGSGGAPPADTTRVSRAKAGTSKTRETSPPPVVTSGPLHGDPIAPPAPVGSGQAVRSSTDAPGTAPGEVVPDAAAEPPPPAEEEPRQCPHISNGEQCRYYAGHLERGQKHIFGGGLQDPISLKHCGTPQEHAPHAWPPEKVAYSCSGAELTPPDRPSEGDGSPDDLAATGTDEAYAKAQIVDGQVSVTGAVPDAPKPMIAAQTKALQARFKGLGWTDEPDDRESRLRVVSTILARAENDQVETFRATSGRDHGGMTYDEAQQVLTKLAPCRTREDVIEVMVQIARALAGPDDEEQAP